jgi:hypothetical protein
VLAIVDSDDTTNFVTWLANSGGITYLYNKANNALIFGTNNTERARIDSSGALLVGETTNSSADGKLSVVQTNDGLVEGARITSAGGYSALYVQATTSTFASTVVTSSTNRAANSAFNFFAAVANNVEQFRVAGNGVIFAQNTTVQSISDQRLKENIRNASEGLDVITALRPVRYDWKEGYGNDRKDQLGFIAQEMEAVFPEAVSEWQVNKEDETVYKTVGPAALIPVLVKAIQEQQAIIQTLTDRITALEQA